MCLLLDVCYLEYFADRNIKGYLRRVEHIDLRSRIQRCYACNQFDFFEEILFSYRLAFLANGHFEPALSFYQASQYLVVAAHGALHPEGIRTFCLKNCCRSYAQN